MPARQSSDTHPLRNPLIAAVCLFAVMGAAITAVVLLAPVREPVIGARAALERAEPEEAVIDVAEAPAPSPVIFAEGEADDTLSLPGVREAADALGGEVQPPPGSNAARALALQRVSNVPLRDSSRKAPAAPAHRVG